MISPNHTGTSRVGTVIPILAIKRVRETLRSVLGHSGLSLKSHRVKTVHSPIHQAWAQGSILPLFRNILLPSPVKCLQLLVSCYHITPPTATPVSDPSQPLMLRAGMFSTISPLSDCSSVFMTGDFNIYFFLFYVYFNSQYSHVIQDLKGTSMVFILPPPLKKSNLNLNKSLHAQFTESMKTRGGA